MSITAPITSPNTTANLSSPPDNILKLIGNTPMLEVKCFDTGLCRLFLKLENQNPGGSIKDRIGLSMIEAAEREGKIKPGYTLVEATAGNTGLGLALTAAKKGYRLILVIPDKMSQEKIMHLRAMGAEIVLTRSDVEKGHPEYYQDYAQRIASEIPQSFYVNQFNNPANPLAHQTSTGPEIWRQMNQKVDAICVGVGSSGTLTGLTHYFKTVHPSLEMVLADPVGSILANYIKTSQLSKAGSWLVEGIGEDFIPAQCDLSMVKSAFTISDQESFETARTLLKKEGILAGSSSGTLIAAALKYAKEQKVAKNIVTFVCDSGNKYLSKMFNDSWMIDKGFIKREHKGTVIDLISRRFSEGTIVTVKSDDTLNVAYSRMKLYDISQLPVLKDGQVVGLIDESDILLALAVGNENGKKFQSPISNHMTHDIVLIGPDEPIEAALSLLKKELIGIVQDSKQFYGLITKIDFLNYLRRKLDE